MANIEFATSSYERGRGGLPPLSVTNMVLEQAPTEKTGKALQSRMAVIDRAADMGTGPVKAVFRKDGVQSGDLFGVSFGALYRGTTYLGAIPGDGPVSVAGNEGGVMAAAGGALRYYNGTTLADVAFPDGASVIKVIAGAGRFIALRADTGKFYWTPILASTVDPLDFATAENQPDNLRDALFIDDILLLFGSETVEFWPNTGDAELPFQPLEGRVIEKGIRGTGCAAAIGSSFAWVTHENQVCMSDENNIISNNGLQERIEASAEVSLFAFVMGGNEYLCLQLDNETQVFQPRTGQWSEWKSYGFNRWVPSCFSGGVFGSGVDGRTLAFGAGHVDLGGQMERLWSAGLPIDGGAIRISNIVARVNVGQTPFLTGDYDDPVIEMRMSRDDGKTWGDWRQKSLGAQGKYRTEVQWRGLGVASRPSLLVQFRVTDPVDIRCSGVLINEPGGGRK
jgi:hypothetical protein